MSGDGVIHIGRVEFRNDDRVFGIKQEDRFSHLYIIGKTGTGKSTLIETMALQDLERLTFTISRSAKEAASAKHMVTK
jgi:ABC-type lipoprotein export system ATPase subunit